MDCIHCKDFTCSHRSDSTGGRKCYYESDRKQEKLLTVTAEASLHYVDWRYFRREAMKDILCSMIEARKPATFKPVLIEDALMYTNALIEKLKDEK